MGQRILSMPCIREAVPAATMTAVQKGAALSRFFRPKNFFRRSIVDLSPSL